MIIDSHTHFGKMLDFDLPQETLIRAMDMHGIDCAVVSNIEGMEYDHSSVPIDRYILRNQISVNQAAIDFSGKYPGRIFPLLWVMPRTGGVTSDFRNFVADNRTKIYGLKFHPFLNQTEFDSELASPYIRLAAEFDLPIAVHTASTVESNPLNVAVIAKKYPGLKLLMVHMGLYSDNEEAIDLILKYPNLYGDTSWVKPENTMKLIRKGGIDKIMFGTDALVSGKDIYSDAQVNKYICECRDVLGSSDHNKLLAENAIRFFNLLTHEFMR